MSPEMQAREKVLEAVYKAFGPDAIVLHQCDTTYYTGAWRNIARPLPEILRDILSRC